MKIHRCPAQNSVFQVSHCSSLLIEWLNFCSRLYVRADATFGRIMTHTFVRTHVAYLSLCRQPKPLLPLCSECVSCPKSAFFFFSQKPRKKDFYTLQDNSNAVCWSLTTIMITLLCIFFVLR